MRVLLWKGVDLEGFTLERCSFWKVVALEGQGGMVTVLVTVFGVFIS
jgi:hypothetical protein